MRKTLTLLSCLAVLALLTGSAAGAELTENAWWNYTSDGLWSTPGNWALGTLPTKHEIACLGNNGGGTSYTINLTTGIHEVGHLRFTYGDTIVLNQSGGTVNVVVARDTNGDPLYVPGQYNCTPGVTSSFYGRGTYNHTGGTHTAEVGLLLGSYTSPSSGYGTYNISETDAGVPTVLTTAHIEVAHSGGAPEYGTFHVIGSGADITTGTYTQNSGGTLKATPSGNPGISTIVVTGAASFDGTLEVVEPAGGYAGPYTLMTYGSYTGDFSGRSLPDGWDYTLSGSDTTAGALTIIPEPATLALLGLGGLGVLIRRRRK